MDMDKVKRSASWLLDAAETLDSTLRECYSESDVEERGFEIVGSVDEIETQLDKIKNTLKI